MQLSLQDIFETKWKTSRFDNRDRNLGFIVRPLLIRCIASNKMGKTWFFGVT